MARKRKRRMPAGLARYWAAKRRKRGKKRVAGRVRRRRMKRNPQPGFPGYGKPIPMKRRKSRKAKRKARKASRKRSMWAGQARAIAASSRKRKRKGVKRKSSKRSRAAKKAARTRKANKARRSAAAKRAYRKRNKKGSRKMARKGKRRRSRRIAARRSRAIKKYRRVRRRGRVRKGKGYSIRRARRSILFTRAHGRGKARAYLSKYRMRSNPVRGLIDALKMALPVAAGYVGARLAAANFARIPGVSSLPAVVLNHSGPIAALLAVVGANYLTNKVGALRKHRTGIMSGVALNAVMTLVGAYAPDSIKGYIGAGDYAYNDAMSNYYAAQADYVTSDDYIESSDYVETGAFEDMAAYEDMAGLGPIPHQNQLVAATQRSAFVQVPSWEPELSRSGLHTGIFGKGGTGWSSWD